MKVNLGAGKNHRIPGWKHADAQAYPGIDYVCDIRRLPFKYGTVDAIYASHCLEHVELHETGKVLKEWARVMKPGGKLYVAVPDWDVVVKVYLQDGILSDWLIHTLYGDQMNPYTYHYTIFNYKTLMCALSEAGFVQIERVSQFPFNLRDCSTLQQIGTGVPASLNVTAVRGGE